MNWEQVYERWERKGKADAVLEGRGLTVAATQRNQVLTYTDDAPRDAWLHAAGTTPSIKALLSGGALPRPRVKRSRLTARR